MTIIKLHHKCWYNDVVCPYMCPIFHDAFWLHTFLGQGFFDSESLTLQAKIDLYRFRYSQDYTDVHIHIAQYHGDWLHCPVRCATKFMILGHTYIKGKLNCSQLTTMKVVLSCNLFPAVGTFLGSLMVLQIHEFHSTNIHVLFLLYFLAISFH